MNPLSTRFDDIRDGMFTLAIAYSVNRVVKSFLIKRVKYFECAIRLRDFYIENKV